ncbi:MAG: hypothetical protein ACYDHC_10655 [Desulfuromonadaceae bacterium]
MKKYVITASIVSFAFLAGCGGGNSSSPNTTVSGKVADGYLRGAEVFLDMNNNYQWDAGEPKTTSGAGGAYSMVVPASDAAKYPVMVRVVAGTTIDEDNINTVIANGYVMSAPAGVAGFVSPMSTLIREKMVANPGMTMNDAMTQLRNQMNLSADIDMMADYVAGSLSGTNLAQYQTMHVNAQIMADLMAGQAALVMNGSGVNQNRYRSMMGTINSNMSAIAANGINSTFVTNMMSQLQAQLGAMSVTAPFMNYSGMFRNMTSHSNFWNTGTPTTPMSGSMMR